MPDEMRRGHLPLPPDPIYVGPFGGRLYNEGISMPARVVTTLGARRADPAAASRLGCLRIGIKESACSGRKIAGRPGAFEAAKSCR